MKYLNLVARFGAAAVTISVVFALYLSARWAYADWLSLRSGLADREHATTLAPNDASVWLRLADLRSAEDHDVQPLLRRALSCSPADATIWTRLGLEAEAFHDYAEAEHSLVRAAELYRDGSGSWTLASFYFRRGDSRHFFPEAQRLVRISRSDLAPVFRMASQLDPDATRILIPAMTSAVEPLTSYLGWLASSDSPEQAYVVAEHLLESFPQRGSDVLLRYCDRLIAAGRLHQAVSLWGDMDAKGITGTGKVRQDEVRNSDFGSLPLNRGFDWRLRAVEGVQAKPRSPGLWVEFDGNQPDRFEIASQPILLSKRATGLQYRLQCSGVAAGSGLHWVISDASMAVLVSQLTDFAADCESEGAWRFGPVRHTGRDDVGLYWLSLSYERSPAAPRVRGWVRINNIAIDTSR